MTSSRVNWTDGLFLKPQHFQQEMRHVESLLEGRVIGVGAHTWGFKELTLDEKLRDLGKLGILSAVGVFPDGTPFNIPEDVEPPLPLDLTTADHRYMVYLCLPSRRLSAVDVEARDAPNAVSRYYEDETKVTDGSERERRTTPVAVARLRTKLIAETAPRDGYVVLGVVEVSEVSKNGAQFDGSYIPPWVNCRSSHQLEGYIGDLLSRLRVRADELANRIGDAERLPAAQFQNAMMLAMVNRYDMLVAHFATLPGLHPERFYEVAVSLAGELSTYVSAKRRPLPFKGYRHDDLRDTFNEVLDTIRIALTDMPVPEANEIPLTSPASNVWVGTVPSVEMLQTCELILSVSANVPTEELASIFTSRVTFAAQERLRDLVVNKVPGVPLNRLPTAPMSVPMHGGALYFQIERKDKHFQQIANALSLHINHDLKRLPELRMTLWAVPEEK